MNRWNRILPVLPLLGFMVGMTACGGNVSDAQTDAAGLERKDASLLVTPSLNLDNLFAPALAGRIRVDEIMLNLTEARMLGSDPRIPPEGVALLAADRLIRSTGERAPAIDFRFPEYLLEDRELTVFLRVGHSDALDGASVVVRGRYIPEATQRTSRPLHKATDPDLDPMDEDPIGNPGCATDPDLDPMTCDPGGQTENSGGTGTTGGGIKGEDKEDGIAFELRDKQVVDLLSGLNTSSSLEVLLGVPADQWITPSLIERLDDSWKDKDENPVVDTVEDEDADNGSGKIRSRSANGYTLEGQH